MEKLNFQKAVLLGKVAYAHKSKKLNMVQLNIEITEVRTQPVYDIELTGSEVDLVESGQSGIFNWDTLQRVKQGMVISISGSVWNSKETDIVIGGQCLDQLLELMPENEILKHIAPIWKDYHLNNMKSGTMKQTEMLTSFFENKKQSYHYEDACEYLESIGLFTDRGYKYGSGWLYKPVPDAVLSELIYWSEKRDAIAA
jgi:hypothetical protein